MLAGSGPRRDPISRAGISRCSISPPQHGASSPPYISITALLGERGFAPRLAYGPIFGFFCIPIIHSDMTSRQVAGDTAVDGEKGRGPICNVSS